MIMRWLIRLAFPALGVLLLLIFFGINTPENTTPPAGKTSPGDIPAFEGLVPTPVPTQGPDIVFKWQDEQGSWHYADQPPEEGPWNALAIERPRSSNTPTAGANPEPDWDAPYRAPFDLDSHPRNGT
ncbi:MAG: DUF4124 domain-containing protein [Pseudomonadota bacterium]|nr:DUF4124 domain-containing protein [Pseudomonadota bacterium]